MKMIRSSIVAISLAVMFTCMSCGKEANSTNDSGSDSQTTPNDSSGAESRSAMGVGEGNQKKELNSDSTRKRHDVDTTSGKIQKDKPHKHE
jgi:hypothetical protein